MKLYSDNQLLLLTTPHFPVKRWNIINSSIQDLCIVDGLPYMAGPLTFFNRYKDRLNLSSLFLLDLNNFIYFAGEDILNLYLIGFIDKNTVMNYIIYKYEF
jgi:hypothetical protein